LRKINSKNAKLSLHLQEIEMPQFQYVEQTPMKLTPLRTLTVEEFEASTPVLQFILPEPVAAPADVTKSVKKIDAMIQKLHSEGGYVPSYDSHVLIGDITQIAILQKYSGDCIIHNANDFDSQGRLDIGIHIDIERDEYLVNIGILRDQLRECISRGVPIIIIPLELQNLQGVQGNSHANVLIYRVTQHTMELFEPNGNLRVIGQEILGNQIDGILQKMIQRLNQLGFQINYVPAQHIFPEWGFQAFESIAPQVKETPEGGYCTLWSCLFIEMVFLNPEKTSREIAVEISSITQNDPMYLRRIIRGYVVETERMLKDTLKSVINWDEFYYDRGSGTFDVIAARLTVWKKWVISTATQGQNIRYK
jgi:hypothetical protein